MKHICKVTVIDKKLHSELQKQYLADPESGMCPCFHVGDEFIFERADGKDDFWHFGRDREPKFPCAEAGIASAGIFILPYRVDRLCMAGQTTTAS